MGLLNRMLGRGERRDSLENPSVDLVQALTVGLDGSTATGIAVSPEKALTFAAVYAAVRLISEDIATVPFHVFETQERGRTPLRSDPRWALLNDQPNPEMTAAELREMTLGHALNWGRGYQYIRRNNAGQSAELWPLRPDRTRPFRLSDGTMAFATTLDNGETGVVDAEDVIVLRAFMDMPTTRLARQSIALGLAAEEYGARLWSNNAQPGGLLLPNDPNMDEEQIKALRAKWEAGHRGLRKSHLIGILPNAKYEQVGLPPEESQFLQSRRFQVQEVARWYRIPAAMLEADKGDSMVYSNLLQDRTLYVTHSLRPWAVRLEQATKMKLFSERERSAGLYPELVLDALLRGDIKTRYECYAVGREWGWRSVNDVLAMENEEGIGPEGDIYLQKVQYVPAGTPVAMYPKLSDLSAGEDVPGVTRNGDGDRELAEALLRDRGR